MVAVDQFFAKIFNIAWHISLQMDDKGFLEICLLLFEHAQTLTLLEEYLIRSMHSISSQIS